MPTLSSRVLSMLAGGPQGRVVLQSTAGILPGLWFLLKTKFQVDMGLELGPLQDQGLREVAMLPPGSRVLLCGEAGLCLPTNQDKNFFLSSQRRDPEVVELPSLKPSGQ